MEAKLLSVVREASEANSPIRFAYKNYDKLVVITMNERRVIAFEDIVYVNSSSNYCFLFLKNEKILLAKTLKSIQEKLDHRFLRVHNSYLVNLNCIKKFEVKDSLLHLLNGSTISVSRSHKKGLLAVLQ